MCFLNGAFIKTFLLDRAAGAVITNFQPTLEYRFTELLSDRQCGSAEVFYIAENGHLIVRNWTVKQPRVAFTADLS